MENQTVQQLTIADLNTIKSVVETACTRGAFRANEMKAVGEIYDKLAGFLDLVVKQAEAQAQSSATAENGATQEEGEFK